MIVIKAIIVVVKVCRDDDAVNCCAEKEQREDCVDDHFLYITSKPHINSVKSLTIIKTVTDMKTIYWFQST